MTCPACGYEHLRPIRTKGIIRAYRCYSCGREFKTIERLYHPDAHEIALDIVGRFRGQVSEIVEER